VGGFIGAEVPRVPTVRLVGPDSVTAGKGQGIVQGHYRAEVEDLRGPLVYSWSSDADVLGAGPKVVVRFDPPASGQARLNRVQVTVTDADGLVASASRRVSVSTPKHQGPRGGPGGSGNPQQEP
jgi:hypothetical protein